MISVAVCTRNRSRLLRNVLADLMSQEDADAAYEILVVDNASTDDTRELVEELAISSLNLRYIHEPVLGLSHARNRAWREARGDFVAYVDDDCRIPRQWVAIAARIAQLVSPCAFGGPHYACYDAEKPHWFKDSYASHVQGETAGELAETEWLGGMNVVFRKDILKELGGFDVGLGMRGSRIRYGEETQMLQRIRTRLPDETVYYHPDLFVRHLVRRSKTSLWWRARARFASGRCSPRAFGTDTSGSTKYEILSQAARLLRKLAADVLLGIARRDKARFPYWQNYVYEITFERLYHLGRLYELLRT